MICPKCGSRAVQQIGKTEYRCMDCGTTFNIHRGC